MISVVVYGRNDAHSIGLQKRAAISLNCIAETLETPTDEIVFVDYNTPDELPTFPEAIADTLTDAARRRLRVLRVRPWHHEPWRRRAAGAVIDSLARNIGARRARPENRWILSTNSDMVLIPRRRPSLSALCAEIEGGCWHLPRFEVPQAVWESLPRNQPRRVMTELVDVAPRLHLKEVVRGSRPAVFDNNGDFQLVSRGDFEAVGGFDERMLHGWAVDSNLAKRLLMRLGTIGSLADRMEGYHCAHHRQVSPRHGHHRVEDDYQRFFVAVDRPELPEQEGRWGLAGEELEEIRLDDGTTSGWSQALEAVVAPAAEVPVESVYNPEEPDQPSYRAAHVLPHLVDLITDRHRATAFAWFGARPRTLTLFAEAVAALGFRSPVMAATGRGEDDGPAPVTATAAAEAIARADVLVFEFGCASQDLARLEPSRPGRWSDDDLRRLAPVRDAFERAVTEERERLAAGAPPRLFVVVNAIHNRCESLVMQALGAGRIPYTTRLRHGYVLAQSPPAPYTPPAVADELTRRCGRAQPVPVTEAVRLMSHAERLLAGPVSGRELEAMTRAAGPLLALLDHDHLVRHVPEEARRAAREAVESARGARRLAPKVTVPVTEAPLPPGDAPCRLATVEDWEDTAFLAVMRSHFQGPFAANLLRRSAEDWYGGHILLQLRARDGLHPDARVLVVAAAPHALVDALSWSAGRVEVLGPGIDPDAPRLRDPARLVRHPTGAALPDGPFDAVVFLPAALLGGNAADTVRKTARRLRTGGVLVLAEWLAVGSAGDGRPHARDFFGDALAEAFREAGLQRLPGQPRLTPATLDHAAWDEEQARQPHFLRVRGDGIATTGTCFFRRTAEAPSSGARLPEALRACMTAKPCAG